MLGSSRGQNAAKRSRPRRSNPVGDITPLTEKPRARICRARSGSFVTLSSPSTFARLKTVPVADMRGVVFRDERDYVTVLR
jgi:hypothetical protein